MIYIYSYHRQENNSLHPGYPARKATFAWVFSWTSGFIPQSKIMQIKVRLDLLFFCSNMMKEDAFVMASGLKPFSKVLYWFVFEKIICSRIISLSAKIICCTKHTELSFAFLNLSKYIRISYSLCCTCVQ